MEGFLFYWLSWIGWVIATFFMPKTSQRWKVTCIILANMMLATTPIKVASFQFSCTYLFLFIIACMYIALFTRLQQLYYLVVSLIIMFAYVSFCLLELYDPVWIFLDRQWLIVCMILYIIFMLVKDASARFVVSIMGLLAGDFLYGMIISRIPFPYYIGALSLLDILALIIGALFIWELFIHISAYIDLTLLKSQRQKQGPIKQNN
ncbi:hypothetical protein FZC66_02995 [Priestia megaterium]|nr:hypothetical protein FZC66_02995 [Priestia megaterium]